MSRVAPWDQLDIPALLALDFVGEGRWRTRHGDANLNDRSYGGQLLGHAMMAALQDVPAGRVPTMMQFLFLQGAMHQEPLVLQVTPLQDGKRFSSRHVRATQGNGRTVLDAQVSCAVPMDAPSHEARGGAPEGEDPLALDTLDTVDPALLAGIRRLGGYSQDRKPSIEFRIPDPERQLAGATPDGSFRFWMRATQPLPDDGRLHAAAFAYLSDWWLNFSALARHQRALGERRLYISSLNHAIWLHRPVRADAWLHVHSTSDVALGGRGLSIGRVHDRAGRHLATLTQELLMAYA